MKYVRVEALFEDGWPRGFLLDAESYVDALPGIAPLLPAGARAFATDPMHYDYSGTRCVKDLRVGAIALTEGEDSLLSLQIRLTASPWKHDEDLRLTYRGVDDLRVRTDPGGHAGESLGDVQLDEILPTASGCSHEIKTVNGSVVVSCRDLTAEWQPTVTEPVDSTGLV
ncbi:hypothetical protein AB0I55_21740 [Actinocatenispora sera]|uniref:hypothetical protein n=1 Tax=Actinocatenispora sera TaxID=390989 RepID=UPI0033F58C49